MSKRMPGHPGEERLLRLADGELAPKESAGVRDHLEACWECRAAMESLQSAVADCVHYRKSVLQPNLPPPPSPWRDLSAGFRAADREVAAESSWRHLVWRAISPPRFWVPAVAAGLVVTLVLVPWLRVTPTVQAAELLRQAVVAAESRPRRVPGSPTLLQVRTKSKKLLRTASTSLSADLRPVAALFESANYEWADPLSAHAYLDWHDRLASKTDEVTHEGHDFYRISTHSDQGELTEATLSLRQDNLRPVKATFKFRSSEWVELTEVPAEPEPEVTAAGPRVNPLAVPQAPASPAALSASDELRVLQALHRIGADLGDPIEISRSASQIEVKGFGIDSRVRRTQIELALRGLPGVSLRFADEAAPPGLTGGSTAPLAVKSATSPLQEFLELRLGGSVAIERFTNEVFDRTESIMARAHAIQRLASRFPGAASLPAAPDLAAYRAMQLSHAQALMRQETELAAVLKPVTSGASAGAAESVAVTGQSILQAARRLERSISMLLGAAPLVGDAAALPGRIAADQVMLEQVTRAFLDNMGQ